MVEGTAEGALLPEPMGADRGEEVDEAKVKCEQLVVWPKQWETQTEDKSDSQDAQGVGSTQTSTGHWWHNSALLGKPGPWVPTPPPLGTQFQGWREKQWAEDAEGEWSYSTGPGVTMIDILREWFGEANFRDTPSWEPWAPGLDHQEPGRVGWGQVQEGLWTVVFAQPALN